MLLGFFLYEVLLTCQTLKSTSGQVQVPQPWTAHSQQVAKPHVGQAPAFAEVELRQDLKFAAQPAIGVQAVAAEVETPGQAERCQVGPRHMQQLVKIRVIDVGSVGLKGET